MSLFRLFLMLVFSVITIYTGIVIMHHGMNLLPVFFGDMAKLMRNDRGKLGLGDLALVQLVEKAARQEDAAVRRGQPVDRVVDRGAEVVRPLAGTDYGANEFAVRDPEGNLWSFGDYSGEPSSP